MILVEGMLASSASWWHRTSLVSVSLSTTKIVISIYEQKCLCGSYGNQHHMPRNQEKSCLSVHCVIGREISLPAIELIGNCISSGLSQVCLGVPAEQCLGQSSTDENVFTEVQCSRGEMSALHYIYCYMYI